MDAGRTMHAYRTMVIPADRIPFAAHDVRISHPLLNALSGLLLTVTLLSCSPEPPDLTPLMGTDEGLIELQWGEGPGSAREKMLRMSGLGQVPDTTFVLTEEPLHVTADSVVPPRLGDLTYRQLRFTGGRFFGYDVEQWQLWFSEESALRNVDIIFPARLPRDELYDDLGGRLLMLYGVPERGGIVWKKFRSRSWNERHVIGEQPETGAMLTWGRIPGQVTISYHDLLYTDSLEQIEYGEPILLKDWNARKNEQ